MTHRNAPLTPLGRQRAVEEVTEAGHLIAHVAAEIHIAHGRGPLPRPWRRRPARSLQRPSSPLGPTAGKHRGTDRGHVPGPHVSARRIVRELTETHHRPSSVHTVTPQPDQLGAVSRVRDITPAGEDLRRPGKITAPYPGHMLHGDVKKLRQIPDDGDWWAHTRGSAMALAGKRAHQQKMGYIYLHSIIDGCSRLVTDNEANYTARAFRASTAGFIAGHQRTRLSTPRHNGEVERHHQLMINERLYARAYTKGAAAPAGYLNLGESRELPSTAYRP